MLFISQKVNLVVVLLIVCSVINIHGQTPPVSVLDQMKPKTAKSNLPNIVLIYADDLGYGDLRCYGATKISTPNIDRLAKEGRLFTDAHSTSAVCTPSRYALLTGEYPFRINNYGPVFCENPLIIDTNKTTLASLLKRKGYATACIGKWHLGFGSERKPDWNRDLKPGPLEVGFDYFYGIPVVNSHPPFVYVENHRVVGLDPADPLIYRRGGKTHGKPYPEKHAAPPKRMPSVIGGKAAHDFYVDEKSAEHLTGKALRWMNKQQQPFFLYYASHNIHHPFTPHPYFHGKSECGLYGDFVEELDWSVGEILAALEKFGVADNTLVIFTSDNGGMFNRGGKEAIRQGHSLNGELKGQKFGAWEGGHRVPFIACWPNRIPAKSTSDALIANMDLLPTLASITQQELSSSEARDGFNQLALFIEDDAVSARNEMILQPHKRSHTSLRKGDWIYIPGAGDGGWMPAKPGDKTPQLYNLKTDPYQSDNLIFANPEQASLMAKRLEEMLVERGVTADAIRVNRKGYAQNPNVILINADDLGYGDLSCYGATKVKTPNIDRLAMEGIRFSDAHSASAVCSPSRFGLLTGQYPIRKNYWGPTPFTQELTIDLEQPTLASTLKSAGYATSVIGKWHLGFGKGRTDWNKPLKPGPLEVGFDYYFGMPTVNSGPPFVYVENHSVVDYDPEDPFVLGKQSVTQKWPEKGGYGAIGGAREAHLRYRDEYVGTIFAEKAVKWITSQHEKDNDQPFFLYLATTNIHHPFTPNPKFRGTSECGLYGDFIHELDWIVGQLLKTLDELKIGDNTLVIFTSDNGGMLNVTGQKAWEAGHRLNGKLLGFKFGAWEGGHRVPFLARWPAKIPAGEESDALISQIDLLPTFAALANANLPKDAVIDGVNQLPVLTGKSNNSQREMLVISPNSPKHLTIRKDEWVYIPAQDEGGFQGKAIGEHLLAGAAAQKLTQLVNSDVQDGKVKQDAPPAQLYDLKTDPYQAINVHNERPEVVAELSSLLERWRREIPNSPRLGWINLRQGGQPSPQKEKGKSNPAPKIPAGESKRSVSLDFESGKLHPWKIIRGKLGHPIGNRTHFFHGNLPYNKQGQHYLTTLEMKPDARKGSDSQTGVIISPFFIPEGGKMTFRVGGGNRPTTYIALCLESGKEVETARGINNQVMQKASWDMKKYAGKKAFIKIVDQSTTGWGHVTADHFEFDGKLLEQYFKSSVD